MVRLVLYVWIPEPEMWLDFKELNMNRRELLSKVNAFLETHKAMSESLVKNYTIDVFGNGAYIMRLPFGIIDKKANPSLSYAFTDNDPLQKTELYWEPAKSMPMGGTSVNSIKRTANQLNHDSKITWRTAYGNDDLEIEYGYFRVFDKGQEYMVCLLIILPPEDFSYGAYDDPEKSKIVGLLGTDPAVLKRLSRLF